MFQDIPITIPEQAKKDNKILLAVLNNALTFNPVPHLANTMRLQPHSAAI